jgi:tRNA (guanine-N7-)-methyltransferase
VRRKLKKFADNAARRNVIEPGKENYETIKGNWRKEHFQNDNPITVELACGRGDYTIGLGRQFPERNFIGVDIKGSRIWNGSSVAEEEGLDNVAFLRTQILLIDKFFEAGEIDEIWITFPDPRPRDRDEKRRLTYPRFLNIYQQLLTDGGWLRLKTDDRPLFDYSLETVQQMPISEFAFTHNVYESPLLDEHYGVQTTYEKRFLEEGRIINYLRCRLHKS